MPTRARIACGSVVSVPWMVCPIQQFTNSVSIAIQVMHRGNQSQCRQAKQSLHVVGALQGVVETLLKESGADSKSESQQNANGEVQRDSWLRWLGRRIRRVHDSNVAG